MEKLKSGESRKDFIHKIKIVLKELKETIICLKIIERARLLPVIEKLKIVINENDELISIFIRSVETASKNLKS